MSDEDVFRLRAKARKSSSRGAEVHIPANYKGFHQGVRAALVGHYGMPASRRHHTKKWRKRIKSRVLGGGRIDYKFGRTRGSGR